MRMDLRPIGQQGAAVGSMMHRRGAKLWKPVVLDLREMEARHGGLAGPAAGHGSGAERGKPHSVSGGVFQYSWVREPALPTIASAAQWIFPLRRQCASSGHWGSGRKATFRTLGVDLLWSFRARRRLVSYRRKKLGPAGCHVTDTEPDTTYSTSQSISPCTSRGASESAA